MPICYKETFHDIHTAVTSAGMFSQIIPGAGSGMTIMTDSFDAQLDHRVTSG